MFLKLLRSKKKLCDHPDNCFTVEPTHVLKCRECDFLLNLKYYFLYSLSEICSLTHAEAYVLWSGGNRSIPCKIHLLHLNEIMPVNQLITTFETVENATRLFRILQEPLNKETPQPEPADLAFFRETVSRQLRATLDRATSLDGAEDYFEGKSVRTIVCTTLFLILKHFESARYFDIIVPHLKKINRRCSAGPYWFHNAPPKSVSDQFYSYILVSESAIHRNYSMTCAAFDAVHVAAFCYLCRDDPGVVYDLVADFAGRLFRGYHDDAFSTPFLQESMLPWVKERLDFHVSSKSNTDIHCFLERLREGGEGLADCFSDQFFKTYWRLKSVLYEEESNDFDYKYPRVFFRDYVDYYAFWIALCQYASETYVTSKNINEILVGIVAPPGTITRCKQLYRLVRTSLSKIKKFHECFVTDKLLEFQKSILIDDSVLFDEEREIETTYLFTRKMWKNFLGISDLPKISIEWLMTLPLFSKNDPELKPKYLEDIYNV